LQSEQKRLGLSAMLVFRITHHALFGSLVIC
jgi:hypothetical protein